MFFATRPKSLSCKANHIKLEIFPSNLTPYHLAKPSNDLYMIVFSVKPHKETKGERSNVELQQPIFKSAFKNILLMAFQREMIRCRKMRSLYEIPRIRHERHLPFSVNKEWSVNLESK